MPTVCRVYGSNSTFRAADSILYNDGRHGSRGFELNMEEHTEERMEESVEDLLEISRSFLLIEQKMI